MSCSALLYSVSLIGENVTPVWHGSHGARFNTSVVEGHAERCHVSESENVSAPSVCVCVCLLWTVKFACVDVSLCVCTVCASSDWRACFAALCRNVLQRSVCKPWFLYSFHHGQNIRSGKGQCPCFQIHPICFYFDCIFNAMVNVR